MYLYISYAMPIVAGFFAEGKSWTTYGPFRLGALSKPFAVIVLVGTVVVVIAGHVFVPSIAADPVAHTRFVPGLAYYSMGFLLFLGALWLGMENKRFKGPPIGAEITKRQAAIAARESALG